MFARAFADSIGHFEVMKMFKISISVFVDVGIIGNKKPSVKRASEIILDFSDTTLSYTSQDYQSNDAPKILQEVSTNDLYELLLYQMLSSACAARILASSLTLFLVGPPFN